MDECLSLDAHVSVICRSTHSHHRNIEKVRNLIATDAAAQIIHVLTSSRLDFCNSILYNLPNNKIVRLQRIYNQTARILTRSSQRNHITPVLRALHWLRINDRINFKILILTHKAFNGSAPEYLCDLITKQNVSVHTRRAEDCYILSLPPISKSCANSFFERSFMYAALTLRNKISQDMKLLDFVRFKGSIKTENCT